MMNHKIILFVDEDEITTDLIECTLNNPYRVIRVCEGKRAIELAQQGDVDIAIITRCLPDIDGLSVVKSLTKKKPSVKVIFTANLPTKELIISAFRSGAKDFLEKPYDTNTLLESINRVFYSKDKNFDFTNLSGKIRLFMKRFFFSFVNPFNVILRFKKLGILKCQFFVHTRKKTQKSKKWNFESTINNIKDKEEHTKNQSVGYENTEKQIKNLAPTLSVYSLGKFQVIANGQKIENWSSRKGRELFTYMVINHKRRIYRDILMETFWPNSDPDSARNCMNVSIHNVRSVLNEINPGYEYILFKNECYYLNPEIEVWSDAEEFIHCWKTAQNTERERNIKAAVAEYEYAAALYKGDFMEEDLYESWPSSERENLKEIYLFILERLSKYYSQDSKPLTAVSLCETILEKDNCREDIHQRLMHCYYRLEQREKSIKQYQKCIEALKTELNVKPTRATIELYEQIKQGISIKKV